MCQSGFLEKYNNQSGDFVLSIVGTDLTLSFPWQRLVLEAKDTMFFGAPFSTTRTFDKHFVSNKSDENYLSHIFKTLNFKVM